MTLLQLGAATFTSAVIILLVYGSVGFKKILEVYKLFFSKSYWTSYNNVEFFSWLVKAAIIVPGLLFDFQSPILYGIALVSSISLIWASNKKLLPTLVWFNTLWVWLSCVAIAKQIY